MSGVAGVKCDAVRIHIVAILAVSPYILILPDVLILKYLKIKIFGRKYGLKSCANINALISECCMAMAVCVHKI